jgi:hypothetical protein
MVMQWRIAFLPALALSAGALANAERFSGGTIVPTFGMTLSQADAAALDQADLIHQRTRRRDFPFRLRRKEPGPAGRFLRTAMDGPAAGGYGNNRTSRGEAEADRSLCRKACAREKSGSGDRFHPIATGFRAVIGRVRAREP